MKLAAAGALDQQLELRLPTRSYGRRNTATSARLAASQTDGDSPEECKLAHAGCRYFRRGRDWPWRRAAGKRTGAHVAIGQSLAPCTPRDVKRRRPVLSANSPTWCSCKGACHSCALRATRGGPVAPQRASVRAGEPAVCGHRERRFTNSQHAPLVRGEGRKELPAVSKSLDRFLHRLARLSRPRRRMAVEGTEQPAALRLLSRAAARESSDPIVA